MTDIIIKCSQNEQPHKYTIMKNMFHRYDTDCFYGNQNNRICFNFSRVRIALTMVAMATTNNLSSGTFFTSKVNCLKCDQFPVYIVKFDTKRISWALVNPVVFKMDLFFLGHN